MLALFTNRLRVRLGRWHRATFGLIRQWQNEKRFRDASGVVTARIRSPYLGLGAHLFMATVVLHRAEREGRPVRFEFTSPQYGDGNWLPHLYHQPTDESEVASSPPVVIGAWADFGRGFRHQPKRSRDDLAALLRCQFSPAPPIAEAVESFATQWFGPQVLGVHYRGTDKQSEARRVSHAEMTAAIRAALEGWPELATVFVATDEADFLKSLGETFCGRRVVSTKSARAHGHRPLHLAGTGTVRRAQEALIDAHLLTRTRLVVKTASALSAWAGFLAPNLPVLVLNNIYARVRLPWFPVEPRPSVDVTASDITGHASAARASAQAPAPQDH